MQRQWWSTNNFGYLGTNYLDGRTDGTGTTRGNRYYQPSMYSTWKTQGTSLGHGACTDPLMDPAVGNCRRYAHLHTLIHPGKADAISPTLWYTTNNENYGWNIYRANTDAGNDGKWLQNLMGDVSVNDFGSTTLNNFFSSVYNEKEWKNGYGPGRVRCSNRADLTGTNCEQNGLLKQSYKDAYLASFNGVDGQEVVDQQTPRPPWLFDGERQYYWPTRSWRFLFRGHWFIAGTPDWSGFGQRQNEVIAWIDEQINNHPNPYCRIYRENKQWSQMRLISGCYPSVDFSALEEISVNLQQ